MENIVLTREKIFGELVSALRDNVHGFALDDSLLFLFFVLLFEVFSHLKNLCHFLVKVRGVSVDLNQLPVFELLGLYEGNQFIEFLKICS